MSLIEPAWKTFFTAHRRLLVYAGLGLLLLGAGLFLFSGVSDYLFKSDVENQKEALAERIEDIKVKTNQITELEKERSELIVNLNTATQQFQDDLFGLEEAKKETDEALANFQRAVNANDNVNRTAQDLEDVLKRLGDQ